MNTATIDPETYTDQQLEALSIAQLDQRATLLRRQIQKAKKSQKAEVATAQALASRMDAIITARYAEAMKTPMPKYEKVLLPGKPEGVIRSNGGAMCDSGDNVLWFTGADGAEYEFRVKTAQWFVLELK